MNAILQALFSSIFAFLERYAARSQTGVDSDRDDGRLGRAGRRLRKWMQSGGSHSGAKPDPSGTKLRDKDLHTD
jgi:hypothetical protein